MYQMLNMVNLTSIDETELYIEVVRVKPQVNQSLGGHIDLLFRDNYNVAEFDNGCGSSNCPVPNTGVYGDGEDYAYEETNDESDEDANDESNGDADVQADGHVSSFQIFNQVLENERGIYVSAHGIPCSYHLPPTPQFEHVENLGNVIL